MDIILRLQITRPQNQQHFCNVPRICRQGDRDGMERLLAIQTDDQHAGGDKNGAKFYKLLNEATWADMTVSMKTQTH